MLPGESDNPAGEEWENTPREGKGQFRTLSA